MWNKLLLFLGIKKRKANPYYNQELMECCRIIAENIIFNALLEERTIPENSKGFKFKTYSQPSI